MQDQKQGREKAAVQMVLDGNESIMQVCREMEIAEATLRNRVDQERRKIAPEYAKLREEKEKSKLKAEDPFSERVLMAVKTTPEELTRENKDLRRKLLIRTIR